MSRRIAAATAAAVCTVLTIAVAANTALKSAGVSEADARRESVTALTSGVVSYYPAAATFRKASPDARAALVKGVLGWVKAWTATPQFRQAWDAERAAAKPAAPETKGSVDDELAAQKKQLDAQIAEMRKNAKQMPPEQRKAMEEAIESMVKMNEEMSKDSDLQAMQKQGMQMQRDAADRQHKEAIARWEKDYPADPRKAIARRIREFLALSADVNFDAKLVSRDGLMRFAEARYEQKPDQWKLCYRAGKPAVAAAREFATAWLAELEK